MFEYVGAAVAQHSALALGTPPALGTPIRVLDADSASKIAAGEVVERPASVAKELIENAIDSGATDISLEVRDGGVSLLRITDNGCGIPAGELALAFERHATSKIASVDDLEAVATLGFRGEALPSIAAVAQVTLSTRPAGASVGARIEIEGGVIVSQGSAGGPAGTAVTVKNLFFNTPARLKFLKSALAEGGQITRVVGQFALAYPGIGFTLLADGRTVFQSSGRGDLLDVISRLYGADVARGMLPVELSEGLQVRGLISQPALSRSSRNYLSIFVNGRLVQSRSLLHAVEDSYSSLLMIGRHPVAVLNVNLDPSQLDVNVHPSKAEVKFASERQVFARVHQAVANALAGCLPPVRDVAAGALGPASAGPATAGFGFAWPGEAGVAQAVGWNGLAPQVALPEAYSHGPGAPETAWGVSPVLQSAGASFGQLPMLRVLGQVAASYIVAEGPGGLYLIDQHAAHERVRLDELLRARDNDTGQIPDTQLLLQPLTIEVALAQQSAVEEARPALARLGFQLEPFGDRTYLLRSVPGVVQLSEARTTIAAIMDELSVEVPGETHEEHLLHSLACHSAVRAGQSLTDQEMRALITALEQCHQPQACAHGRPTMVHLSQAQLEREFGRR